MINKKINTFEFLEKRLLFQDKGNSPEVKSEAISAIKIMEVKTEHLNKITEKPVDAPATAETLIAAAKVDLKAKYPNASNLDYANGLLDSAIEEFRAKIQKVKERAALKATLGRVDVEKDPAGSVLAFIEAKVQAEKLKATFGENDSVIADVAKKETALKGKLEEAYEKLPGQVDDKIKVVKANVTSDGLMEVMGLMSGLQTADYSKYALLDEAKAKTLKEKYKTKIDEAAAFINSNQDKLNDDQKGAWERLSFARTNLKGAEDEDNKENGHLMGAKEYMEMVLAEQAVRALWQSLPFDADPKKTWRPGSDMTQKVSLSDWPTWGERYNAAVDLFQRAVGKTSRGKGEYGEAKKLFKEALTLFSAIAQRAKNEAMEKLEAAKAAADTTEMDNYNRKLDEVNTAYNKVVNGPAFVKKHVNGYLKKDLAAAKASADKGDYKGAIEALGKLATKVNQDMDDYKSFLSKGKSAIGGAIHQMVTGGAYQDDTKAKIINDYLNNPGTFSGIPAWLKGSRGEVKVSGQWVYDSADSKQLYKLSGSLWGVNVSDTGVDGNNDQTANTFGTSRVTVEAPQGGFDNVVDVLSSKHKNVVKKSDKSEPEVVVPKV